MSRRSLVRAAMILAAVAAVFAMPFTARADRKGVEDIGDLIHKGPTYIIGNVRLYGRIKSLITEMNLKDGYNELDFDTPIDPKSLDDASILILVDRENGDLPSDLEYLLPLSVKGVRRGSESGSSERIDKGDSAVFATDDRNGKHKVVYISAPNRDALIDFINVDLRNDEVNMKDYASDKRGAKIMRKTKRPSAPEILFPVGTLKTTRPPIFFVANRSDDKRTFDIQLTPSTGAKDRKREEFGREGTVFQTTDGGWVAFDKTVKTADDYELDLWGVKPQKQLEKQNKSIYIYYPDYDVLAGRSYAVRVRGKYPDARDSKPGLWSSDEEETPVQVPQQPANLGPAESLTSNQETTEFTQQIYSGDGKLLLYSTNRSSKGGDSIWEVFADNPEAPGTGSTKITDTNRGSSDYHPSWGPSLGDGVGYVTFSRSETSQRSADKTTENLWYVAVPTAAKPDVPFGMTQLTNFDERCFQPSWSGDGKRCAFCKENGRGEVEIWIVEPGKNPRVLVPGITPAWAPDNRTLYYASKASGSYDIWTIDTLSGQTKTITSGPGDKYEPAVNPTGNGDIAYVSTAAGNEDVWVLRGRNAIQLTQWLGNDCWPSWTPDGKKLVFSTTRFSTRQHYGLASIDPYGSK